LEEAQLYNAAEKQRVTAQVLSPIEKSEKDDNVSDSGSQTSKKRKSRVRHDHEESLYHKHPLRLSFTLKGEGMVFVHVTKWQLSGIA
jgi:hypothetical protein